MQYEKWMTNKAFRCSIRHGTGQAYIIACKKRKPCYTNEIISACIKNYAYDGQCENSRAPYLYRIIRVAGNIDKIKKAILKALLNEKKDTWSLTQLFDLALQFAKENDKTFRDAIYHRFYTKIIQGSDWVGYKEIIELDGFEGLKYIATVMGRDLINNPNTWQDDWIVTHFSEMNPQIDTRKELEKIAITSPEIARYLQAIDETKSNRKKNRVDDRVYSTLNEEIRERRILYPLKKRNIPEYEIKKIAEAFIAEKDEKYIEKYLHFFSYFKYPYDGQILLNYAQMKNNSNNSIVERAIDSLEFISSESVRQFAIDQLNKSKFPERYTNLLIHNYKIGDNIILEKIARKAKAEYVIEELAQSYSKIYENNILTESFKPLLIIYNKMTCGNCRELIVQTMIKNDVLPKNICEEIQYDSNEDIRELWRKNLTTAST